MSDDIIHSYFEFCNSRHIFHSRRAASLTSKGQHRAASLHDRTASQHASMADWFSEYLEDPPITRKSVEDLFSLNPLDLDGLDKDVRDELSISDSDVQDAQIIELLEISGRSLDLNEIILGSVRKYKTKHKRTQLTARIHRLVAREEVSVVGKGQYSLPKNVVSALVNNPDLANPSDVYEDEDEDEVG